MKQYLTRIINAVNSNPKQLDAISRALTSDNSLTVNQSAFLQDLIRANR